MWNILDIKYSRAAGARRSLSFQHSRLLEEVEALQIDDFKFFMKSYGEREEESRVGFMVPWENLRACSVETYIPLNSSYHKECNRVSKLAFINELLPILGIRSARCNQAEFQTKLNGDYPSLLSLPDSVLRSASLGKCQHHSRGGFCHSLISCLAWFQKQPLILSSSKNWTPFQLSSPCWYAKILRPPSWRLELAASSCCTLSSSQETRWWCPGVVREREKAN